MFYLFKNGECDTMCRSRKGLEKLIPKNTADEYVILEFDGFHTPYDLYIENGEIRVRRLPDMEPPDDVIAKQVRAKRDRLIAETDYLAMSDYPLSDEDKAAVMAYRQALRDVPAQEVFPREVVWPEVPAVFKRTKG